MTDARLAPTFLHSDKVERLDDVSFRVYVNAVVYAASHETDGRIPRRSLRLLHPTADVLGAADRLVAAGCWEPIEDGWQIHDFLNYQTPKAQLDAVRSAARSRKQRSRAAGTSRRDTDAGRAETPGDVTPEVTSGHTPGSRRDAGDVTAADIGQRQRQGQDAVTPDFRR